MKAFAVSLLIVLLLSPFTQGQLTLCSSWNTLEGLGAHDLIKDWYLAGIVEGLLRLDNEEEWNKFYYAGEETSMEEELDQFCSDYNNTRIPIVYALEVISMKMRGEPQKEINEFLRTLRSIAVEITISKKDNHRTGDVWVLDAERGVEDDEWLLLPKADKTKK